MIKYFLSIILIATLLNSSAQVREIIEAVKPKKAFTGEPVIKKNNQLVSISAGVPNNIGQFLNFGGFGSFFSTAKSGTGPFFIRYEYLVKDNIGIGASVSYARAEETYKNPFGSGTVTGNIAGFSVLLSSYYHFYTTNKFDTYTKGSVGINIWSGSYQDENDGEVQKFTAPAPVAYHAVLGIRYFITPGVHLTGDLGYSNLRFSAGFGVGFKLK
jgi:hypothetical protein